MSEASNIARHLPAMAALQPDRAAIKVPRGTTRAGDIDYLCLSFAELETEAALWQRRLEAAGVRRGDRTLVMVRPGLPLIAAVFALFATGAVPIVIDPGMGLRAFLACVRRSRPRALVGIPLARLISRVALGSFAGLQVRVAASARLDARLGRAGDQRQPLRIADTQAGDPAAILFTSGSTGAPKGVCYEQGMFEAQVRLVRETYDIRPGETDLPMLPVFALFNPALGMTTVVPELNPRRPAELDPARIVRAIRQEGVTNSFGSPTLWGRVGDYCIQNNITLPTLRRVLCAGAPVPAALWQASTRFLVGGRLHSPYGATEALPVSSIDSGQVDFNTLRGAPVGRVVPGVSVRIIPVVDGPVASVADAPALPPGQLGEILVGGPNVTRQYDALPEATAAAKVAGDKAGEIWHRMGDTGFLDEQGMLWFCGRKAERVRTAAGDLPTEPCERVFRQHPRVRRCALVGLGAPGNQVPALVVEGAPANDAEARAWAGELRALAAAQPHTASLTRFFFHPRFPVDVRHNAKIHRLTLARWAATKGRVWENAGAPSQAGTRTG